MENQYIASAARRSCASRSKSVSGMATSRLEVGLQRCGVELFRDLLPKPDHVLSV